VICQGVFEKFFYFFYRFAIGFSHPLDFVLSLSTPILYTQKVNLSIGFLKDFLIFERFVENAQLREKYFFKFC
jgi:hypothetical protein